MKAIGNLNPSKVMARKVLILNSDYRALTVCSVEKAFILVYLNKAEIVKKVENAFMRSVSSIYSIPSVIRLNSYVSVPFKGVMLSRQNVFKRDNHRCVYCNSPHDLTLDHVLPRSRGGKTTWSNLVAACKKCNARKGDYLPEEAGMLLPYKPFKPSFIVFLRQFSGTEGDNWLPYLQSRND